MDEETIHLTVESFEDLGIEYDIQEARIKKVVNRRGQITKHQTAGVAGRKIVNGKVSLITGQEKRAIRLGAISRRRKLKSKSAALRRRSALFAKLGRKKRQKMHVTDTRHG